jgi:hypothetical protein
MREKHWLGVNNVPQTSPWPTAYISLAFVVPCSMLHKLTGHEQDVLATLVQHMRNPLDEFSRSRRARQRSRLEGQFEDF